MENLNTLNVSKEPVNQLKNRSFRFDIFKGTKDPQGKVHKMKSVGSAHQIDGCKTYTVHLKTFLNDVFYLLPETKKMTDADFVILTREISQQVGRKYFWNNVGEGSIQSGENSGFLNLQWDVLGTDDIYMNLYPKESPYEVEAVKVLQDVSLQK